MSKTTKWVIVVVVVVVVGLLLWWSGVGAPSASQSGAVLNSTAVSPALDQINRDVANIDAQLQMGKSELESVGSAPSKEKVLSLANRFKGIVFLMTAIRINLESAVVNTNLTTGFKPVFTDLNSQITNAGSQVGAAVNNTSNISSTATTANNAVLKQDLLQLITSQTYLKAARADIAVIVKGLR